jgi:hypothetical protein
MCFLDLCKKAPEKLIYLADLCSFMMFFFFWLSLMVGNEEGLTVALSVGAFAVLLTILVVLIHIRRGGFGCHCCKKRQDPSILPLAQARTVDEPDAQNETIRSKAETKAFFGMPTLPASGQFNKTDQSIVGA